MMPTQLNGLKKTAILLVSLGEEQASRILSRLPAEAIPHIQREIADIGEISDEQRRQILDEFRNVSAVADEFPQEAIDISPPPFARFAAAEPVDVRRAISQEHPQTIAVVLTYLPRELACDVLSQLPPALQVEIINRISCIQPPDERVVREIERVIEARVGPLRPALPAPQTELARVLDEADHRQPHDAGSFEDLLILDAKVLCESLEQVNHETIALAMTTTAEHVQRWIFNCVGRERAQLIHASMQFLGPVRIRDVESAQNEILTVVRGTI